MSWLPGIIQATWDIITASALYTLIGFFIAGLIHIFLRPEQIRKYLGKNNFSSVFWSALWGVPMPLCSCSVIPVAVSLRQQGASKAATVAFLISAPESGVDSIAMSWAILNPLMAIFRPIAAFLTAFLAGTVEILFNQDKKSVATSANSTCCHHDEHNNHNVTQYPIQSWKQKIIESLKYAFVDLMGSLSKYFIIGFLISGCISYFVPNHFIESYLSDPWISMIIMLLIGLPMYVCATSSTPIAAVLMLKGMAPGAALVFLLAGPATNVATMLVVLKSMGKRSLFTYLISISLCALILGAVLNYLHSIFIHSMPKMVEIHLHTSNSLMDEIAGVIFIMLIGYGLWIKVIHNK